MLPDRVSYPGPLTYESGALPIEYQSKSLYYKNKILNIGTKRSDHTVQTKIRLLLKEQSDPGLHW